MTIRAKLFAQKQKADAWTFGSVAFALVTGLLAAITSTPWLAGFTLAGMVAGAVASYWRLDHIKCLRCGGELGYVISYRVWPFAAPDVDFCPHCGISFDAPIDATPTPNHAMEPTTGRGTPKFSMTLTSHPAATRALASGGSSCSR
jgi:hypothetical protein